MFATSNTSDSQWSLPAHLQRANGQVTAPIVLKMVRFDRFCIVLILRKHCLST